MTAGSAISDTRLADVAELRAGSYLVFGALLRQPQHDLLAEARRIAAALFDSDDVAREFSFYRSWQGALDAVARTGEGGQGPIQSEYASLFEVGVGNAGHPCPLYESAYLDRTGHDAGLIVSTVEQAYSVGGLELSNLAQGELPDHVSLELEYMALLCAREAEMLQTDDRESALDASRLQKSFLEEHLAAWLPALVRRIKAGAQSGVGIYPMLGEATLAFVTHDVGLVAALLEAERMAAAQSGGEREQ